MDSKAWKEERWIIGHKFSICFWLRGHVVLELDNYKFLYLCLQKLVSWFLEQTICGRSAIMQCHTVPLQLKYMPQLYQVPQLPMYKKTATTFFFLLSPLCCKNKIILIRDYDVLRCSFMHLINLTIKGSTWQAVMTLLFSFKVAVKIVFQDTSYFRDFRVLLLCQLYNSDNGKLAYYLL